ncbi:MAG: PQQ-dependent sugar dehydrogenase [Acidobacteria bacterium]|nr:PQQ-dependent sugar dehydrogenase [Acidobacteriota bacterium]
MRFLLFYAYLFLALSCGGAPAGLADGATVSTAAGDGRFRVETVASGLEVPWGFAFLPGGNLLFTERPGRVRIVENGRLRAEPVFKVPDVEPSGESGLMDIALHPKFADNRFVYLAYAYNADGKRVKVVRYRYDGSTFTEPKTIIDNLQAAQFHAGTRCRFGPDGKLYVTVGDATDRALAQRMDVLNGKTLRLNDDGSVPPDNPFAGQKDARPEIWSVGHRNAQGLAWTAAGLMIQTEHGPSGFDGPGGGDEVNIVEAGKNYGWPIVSHRETKEGLVSPLLEYTPACAPASAVIYQGAGFPAFQGNLFFGCLRGERIIRAVLDGRTVKSQENLLEGKYGRIRELAEGPDGLLYFSTSNRDGRGSPAKDDDRIMRLVPVK